MKSIQLYVCEHCGTKYKDKNECKKCESNHRAALEIHDMRFHACKDSDNYPDKDSVDQQNEYIIKLFLYKKKKLREGTKYGYMASIKRLITVLDKPLVQMDEHDIFYYLNWYENRNVPVTGRKNQNSTLNSERRYLSAFFSWMRKEKLITVNPVEAIEPLKVQRKPIDFFTPEEMARLRDSCRTLRERALIDVKISAQKASPYSRIANNELAKELFGMGLFNPQLADQALAVVSMMDFDRREEMIKKISENGTMYQEIQQLQQILAQLAPMVAEMTNRPDLIQAVNGLIGNNQMAMTDVNVNQGNSIKTNSLGQAVNTDTSQAGKAREKAATATEVNQ